ncbi:hypothetical protein NQZ68_014807 [Dissostichus eleginoides]|nr:hypothetical protein NQZ68_014807 [Dissostichus eleginoides]
MLRRVSSKFPEVNLMSCVTSKDSGEKLWKWFLCVFQSPFPPLNLKRSVQAWQPLKDALLLPCAPGEASPQHSAWHKEKNMGRCQEIPRRGKPPNQSASLSVPSAEGPANHHLVPLILFSEVFPLQCHDAHKCESGKTGWHSANLRLFEPDTEPSSTRLDSDTEEEDSELDVDEAQEEPIG